MPRILTTAAAIVALAASAPASSAMPMNAASAAAPGLVVKVDSCKTGGAATADGRKHDRRAGNCQGGGEASRVVIIDSDAYNQRRADCHRDVRTHRVNGVMLKHRHVGEDCAIRVVTSSSSG